MVNFVIVWPFDQDADAVVVDASVELRPEGWCLVLVLEGGRSCSMEVKEMPGIDGASQAETVGRMAFAVRGFARMGSLEKVPLRMSRTRTLLSLFSDSWAIIDAGKLGVGQTTLSETMLVLVDRSSTALRAHIHENVGGNFIAVFTDKARFDTFARSANLPPHIEARIIGEWESQAAVLKDALARGARFICFDPQGNSASGVGIEKILAVVEQIGLGRKPRC